MFSSGKEDRGVRKRTNFAKSRPILPMGTFNVKAPARRMGPQGRVPEVGSLALDVRIRLAASGGPGGQNGKIQNLTGDRRGAGYLSTWSRRVQRRSDVDARRPCAGGAAA